MAMLIEDILHENIPQPVRELLSTNEIFAAPKKDGDVRPIGMGLTLRKIAAKVCLNASQGGFNQGKFGTEQSALKEHGMEKICHLFGTEMERDDTLDVYNADGDNAYNVANRVGGAWETMNSFPQALAYARSTYLDPSTAHFFEDSGNIRPISSRVGFHQGDVLATWLYIMSIQPMLKRIIDHVEREFGREEVVHVKFYVDDGNFMAPHHIMLSIISLLENAYDEFGYRLKKNKGSYLLGRCGSAEEANARAQGLIERGFSPEIIKIHPENCEDKDAAKVKYGTKMLGAFLGTDEYIQANLREHLEKLRAEAKLLMEYPDVQGRYHLFKMCLMNKPNHLMRTTRPDLMAEFIGEWDKIVMLVIESFFHCALDTFTRDNVCLPTSLGGIGIHKPGETYVAAYTASFSEFFVSAGWCKVTLAELRAPPRPLTPRYHWFLETALVFIGLTDVQDPCDNIKALLKIRVDGLDKLETFQNHLSHFLMKTRAAEVVAYLKGTKIWVNGVEVEDPRKDLKKLRWLMSLRTREAGAWLDVGPTKKEYRLKSSLFRICLLFRYLRGGEDIPAGLKCDTFHTFGPRDKPKVIAPTLDKTALHLVHACHTDKSPTVIHDTVALELTRLCQQAGLWAEREKFVFRAGLPGDNHRSDITIHHPPSELLPKSTHIDLAITSSLEGSLSCNLLVPSLNLACQQGHQADAKYKSKVANYKKVEQKMHEESPDTANAHEYVLVPFVMESTGLIHPESLKFLEQTADEADLTAKLGGECMLIYFKRRISFTFQRALANVILSRTKKISNHRNSSKNRSSQSSYIIEEGPFINSRDVESFE
jgi:hypothetical protein